jgi:MraZ protein
MFLGQYTHSIDAKGRLIIPVKFRPLLAQGAYVVRGFDPNLVVYTTDTFQLLSRQANATSATDPEARAMRRFIFGSAQDVSLDSAGRILIPGFLRQYAHLDGETVLVGAGQYFEIWNAELWEKELARVADPELSAGRFATFSLATE